MHSDNLIYQKRFNAERRFEGLRRLYGTQSLARLRNSHVAIIGLGGVGSWTTEALARSAIGNLTLIDLDHIAESNINRQIHALSNTLGRSKVEEMATRVLQINPNCKIVKVEEFISPENTAELLRGHYQAIIDCTDQVSAKAAVISYARTRQETYLLSCGGVGGKTDPLKIKLSDLSEVSYDALLSKLRKKIRYVKNSAHSVRKYNVKKEGNKPKMGIPTLWVDQPQILPIPLEILEKGSSTNEVTNTRFLHGLSCAGYGSVVSVTAVMGLVAANEAIKSIVNTQY